MKTVALLALLGLCSSSAFAYRSDKIIDGCELAAIPDNINAISYYDYFQYGIAKTDVRGENAQTLFNMLQSMSSIRDLYGNFIYEARSKSLSHRILPYKPSSPSYVRRVYLFKTLECENSVVSGYLCREFCRVGQYEDETVPGE